MILVRYLAELRGGDVGAIASASEPGPRKGHSTGPVWFFRNVDPKQNVPSVVENASIRPGLPNVCWPPISTSSFVGLTIGPGTGPPAMKLGGTQRTAAPDRVGVSE